MKKASKPEPVNPESLSIEMVPLSEIQPAARNPKQHDVGALIESFRRFGFVTPGVRDERTGRIAVGHGRAEALAAMKEAGEAPPARITVREDGERLVPIVCGVRFRTDHDAEAFLVADNRLTELGGWDHALLYEVLTDLAGEQALAGTGYDGDDVDAMAYLYGDGAGGIGGGITPHPGSETADDIQGDLAANLRLTVVFTDVEESEAFFECFPGADKTVRRRAQRPGGVTCTWAQLNAEGDGA